MKFQKTSFGTSLTVSSLHPFFTYSFSVAAYTVDLGPFTEPAVLQMPQDGKNIAVSKFLFATTVNIFLLLVHAQLPPLLQATALQ